MLSPVPQPIAVEQALSSVTVVAGDTIQLKCSAYSVTPFSVTWRKAGQSVKDSRFIKQQPNATLFVHVRRREDAGQFECIAANEGGDIVRKINLIVHGKYQSWLVLFSEPFWEGFCRE